MYIYVCVCVCIYIYREREREREREKHITPFLVTQLGKEPACNAGDAGLIPRLGRLPGEGNDNPVQYSCLKNPMDRGVWQAAVHGVTRVGHD